MFFIVILILLLAAHGYVGWRVWQLLPLPTAFKVCALVLIVAQVLVLVLPIAFKEVLPSEVVRVLYRIGTAWVFVFVYLCLFLLVADLLTWLIPTLRPYYVHSWVGTLALAGAMVLLFAYGNYRYHNKERVSLDLYTKKTLKPLRIVAVSDLHLGYTIGRSEVAEWVDKINAEEPDLVLIAGDIIDNSPVPVRSEGSHLELRRLKARYGVYACLGNHEYLSNRQAITELIKEAGIHLLADEAVLVDSSFYVVGRDDAMNRYRKPHVAELVQGLDRSKPILLLDHQPRHLEQAEAAGITMQISGHTHNGQVWPISWIVRAMYEQPHGYLRKGDTHIYVSSGLGLWGGKFRIGTQSEYVVINLSGSA